MFDEDLQDRNNEHFDAVPELPKRVLSTYARLWQLETWLRRMLYVELRAQSGDDWARDIRPSDRPRDADKRLTHMPTPEDDRLSFAQFSELQRVISNNWDLFSPYLPPKNIWDVKLEEVTQIRHRVAHFRYGHSDDLQRILQLLRDIDRGFWTFCTSYNSPWPILPASDDPVTIRFLEYDPFPYTEVESGKWARVGIADPGRTFSVTVESLRRPWVDIAKSVCGTPGYLYDVRIGAREQRTYDYREFLERTRNIHGHLAHLCLDTFANSVRLTIPAVLGADGVIDIIESAVHQTQNTISRRAMVNSDDTSVERFSEEWPEFVLGPSNPLTFLDPDMPCKFFNA